jgi:hypothetical protein
MLTQTARLELEDSVESSRDVVNHSGQRTAIVPQTSDKAC